MRHVSPAAIALLVAASSAMLGGCSGGMRLGSPTWSLTGNEAKQPARPSAPVTATPDQDRPAIPYRGGRDPVTGRAPAWAPPPLGVERRDLAPPPSAGGPRPGMAAVAALQPAPLPQRAPVVAGQRTVEVLPGHSLAVIAARHRVSIAALMAANKMRDPYVYPGQVLILP